MSVEEKNKIIINNYFYISNENLEKFLNRGVIPIGNIQKNISIQIYFWIEKELILTQK